MQQELLTDTKCWTLASYFTAPCCLGKDERRCTLSCSPVCVSARVPLTVSSNAQQILSLNVYASPPALLWDSIMLRWVVIALDNESTALPLPAVLTFQNTSVSLWNPARFQATATSENGTSNLIQQNTLNDECICTNHCMAPHQGQPFSYSRLRFF